MKRENPKIQDRLRQVNADSVAIFIVTVEEKMKGGLAAINSRSEIERVDHPWGCACAFILLLPTEPCNPRLSPIGSANEDLQALPILPFSELAYDYSSQFQAAYRK